MLDQVVDAFAEMTGCDREALAQLVRGAEPADRRAPDQLARMLDALEATERLVQAAQAVQVRRLAALNAAYLGRVETPTSRPVRRTEGLESGMPEVSRVAAAEVAVALRIAPTTAGFRLDAAVRAVGHPELLARVGTGTVSMAGLGRVLEATAVLDPDQRRVVDSAVAAEAGRRPLTPGELGKAADRRVLQTDPEAAARRVARSRRQRFVRLTDPVDGTAGIYARVRAEDAVSIVQRIDGTARVMRSSGDERSLDVLRADLFVEALTGRSMVLTAGPDSRVPAARPPRPGEAAPPHHPSTWRSINGVEPVFGQQPPTPADDPPPDDPVWDTYPDGATGPGPETVLDPETRLRRLRAAADPDPPKDREAERWHQARPVEVQVVLSLASVLGLDDQPGVLRGYGAVPAATVLDIIDAAEATGATTVLRGLFCDPVDGRLVTMESQARRFEGGLRSFGTWRDQVDRLTGGRLADLDHVQPRREGGPTTAGNAQGLGQLTNRVVKEHPGVHVRTLPVRPRHDGLDRFRRHAPDIEWTLPSGRRHVSRPRPVLGLGSDPHDEPSAVPSALEQFFGEWLSEARR